MSNTATFALPSGRTKMRVRDMSQVAPDFRSALSKCDHLVANGKNKEAFEVMVKSLIVDRVRRRDGQKAWKLRKWADIKAPMAELFRLAFSVRSDVGDIFHEMWQNLSIIRDNMRGNPNAEDVWTNVTKEIRANVVSLLDDAEARSKAGADDDDLVSIVSGRAPSDLMKARFSVDGFVASVISRTLNPRFMGTGVPMLRLALDVAESFAATVTEYKLSYAAQALAKVLLGPRGYLDAFLFSNLTEYTMEVGRNIRANEQARQLRESRAVFEREVSLMERTFEISLLVGRTAHGLTLWQSLSESVSMTTRILMEFLSEDTPTHRPVIVNVYKSLADIFLQCDNRTFHALCLARAAAAQHKLVIAGGDRKDKAASAVLSTTATLAALAAPDISERRNQFGANDADFRRFSEIADMFKLAFPPSRTTLCADLRISGALADAHSSAKSLHQLLTDPLTTIDVCATTSVLLAEADAFIGGGATFEDVCGSEIRRCSLTRFFRLVSEESNAISLRDPRADAKFKCDTEAAYATMLAVLVDELNVPVLVDQGDSSVTFTSAGLTRIHNTFSQLAIAATPARKPPTTQRAPLPITLDELELESNRLVAFHSLVKDRVHATAELKKKRKLLITAQKEAKKQAIITEEMDRQKAQLEQNMKRMAKEYQLAELKERRKLLIQRLQEKHKGLKVNPAIIDLSQPSFMENLTATLTEFQRRLETSKRSDVRRMDHFERACREKDIPKRKEIGESMAAELEAERAIRWENFKEQHRKEYEEKKAIRERLQKFVPHAIKYEAQLNERTAKTTKRDEQEELLRAEKARLAQSSGAAAPAPAAAAPAPAAAAPAPQSGSAPAPAKWQPKAR